MLNLAAYRYQTLLTDGHRRQVVGMFSALYNEPMIIRLAFSFLLLVLCSACEFPKTGTTAPAIHLRAEFNPDLVNQVEAIGRSIGEKWEFEIFEKDRDRMKFLTQGQEAFSMMFLLNGELILSFANHGVGTILSLMIFQKNDMPLESLQELADEFSTRLNQDVGVLLLPHSPKPQVSITH